MLAAQIEQTRQLGQKLEAKILDVRDVDVSYENNLCFYFSPEGDTRSFQLLETTVNSYSSAASVFHPVI